MTGGQASTVGRPQGYLDSVKAPLAAAPGGKFQYGPAPMQVVGEILRRKLIAKCEHGTPRHHIERSIIMSLGVTVGDWRGDPEGDQHTPQCIFLAASERAKIGIGRAHDCTQVKHAHLVCLYIIEK